MSSTLSGGNLSGGNLSGGNLSGGADAVDSQLEGGSPKHHVKVMRADGTHYWRRTKSAMKRGYLHHKERMRRKSAKKSPRKGKKRSAKK